jgi:hypothetical protein
MASTHPTLLIDRAPTPLSWCRLLRPKVGGGRNNPTNVMKLAKGALLTKESLVPPASRRTTISIRIARGGGGGWLGTERILKAAARKPRQISMVSNLVRVSAGAAEPGKSLVAFPRL